MLRITTETRRAPSKRRGLARSMIVVALAMMVALPLVATPAAAQNRMIVSGNATASDCNGDRGLGAIELTGDLEGCWIFLDWTFRCQELNGFARYREAGKELFIGTLHGERGRFRTRYTLDAIYESGSCAEFESGGYPGENQLAGGCDHRVFGKKGAFENMRGLITFFDIIPDPGESGASNYFWAGRLRTTA